MADKVVNVKVNADVSAAKQAITDLQTQLNNLTSPTNLSNMNLDSQLMKAAQSAEILKAQLQSAVNVDTGRLDLTKFQQQLSQSGMSLQKYQQTLSKFGPEGQKAFASLASSIVQAEIPLRNMNTMTQKMWTSIKNTINWQISSSLIHGIVGQMSSMVNYAKDLDTSLNRIQIVTGSSSDKMARFAAAANKAAKELNTTTTAYTNASLIYYQQGLSDKEVAARTAVTVKMANVTKDSVTEVSNQMTAIWNNFADGATNLEHYADVITALGAATASSSAEIARGLQKFAAIADTVGLSYENATAALATIVATTRQSEDTVGTGLRTLFSRLQSLSLGETLEDGVNLTKYTKALNTVGVQAVDAAGNLRSMDDVLMDLGENWDTLSKAQQIALAQTVGGVRQYTNLIALMDNFDFYKSNLQIALTSDGTLQQQADIYAESWEAASNRVRASAEGIYSRLIDSKDFVNLMDGFSGFLEMIQGIIDGLGGLKGVLVTLGAIATQVFSKQISQGLNNMGTSLMTMTKSGRQRLINIQMAAAESQMAIPSSSEKNLALQRSYANQQKDNIAYLAYGKNLNETQLTQARTLMNFNRGIYEQGEQAGAALSQESMRFQANYAEQLKAQNQAAQATYAEQMKTYQAQQANYNNASPAEKIRLASMPKPQAPTPIDTRQTAIQARSQAIGYARGDQLSDILSLTGADRKAGMAQWEQMRAGIIARGYEKTEQVYNSKTGQMETRGTGEANYEAFFSGMGDAADSAVQAAQALDKLATSTTEADQAEQADALNEGESSVGQTLGSNVNKYYSETDVDSSKLAEAERNATNTAGSGALAQKGFEQYLQQQQNAPLSGGEAMTKLAGVATAAASAVMMLSNAFQVLGSDSATGAQKLGAVMSIIMGIGTAVPAVVSAIDVLKKQVVIAGVEMQMAFWEFALIMAAIAAVVGLVAVAINNMDTPEKQMKQAVANAQELNDQYEALKDKAQSLKDAFDNYDSIYESLENCIKYSDEWYETLDKIQSTVFDLLQEFPELAEYKDLLKWDAETGTYRLNEDIKQQALEDAQNKELAGKSAATQGNLAVKQLAVNQEYQTAYQGLLNRFYQDVYNPTYGKLQYDTGKKTNEGSTIYGSIRAGELLPNWLSSIDVQTLQSFINNPEALKASLKNALLQDTSFQEIANAKGISTEDLLISIDNELSNFADTYSKDNKLNDLINAYKDKEILDTQILTQGRVLASQALGGKNYSSTVIDMASRDYQNYYTQQYATINSTLQGVGRGGRNDNWDNEKNAAVRQVINEYLEAIGENYRIAEKDMVIQEKGVRFYQFYDENGDIVKKSEATIASTVAAARAMEHFGTSADEAQRTLQTFDNNFTETFGNKEKDGTLNQGMKNFIATKGFGSDMTSADIGRLNTQIDAQGGAENFLSKMFGLETLEEKNKLATSLGYKDFAEMINVFTQTLERAEKSNINAITELNKVSNLNTEKTSQLSTSQANTLTNLYQDAKKFGGPELTAQLDKMFGGMTTEQMMKTAEVFSTIDWSSLTAVDQAMEKIREIAPDLYKELEENGFDFSGFLGKIREVEIAANGIDISGFVSAMAAVQNLLNGKASAGTTIAKDDLKQYEKFDLSKLGYLDSDGNFTFTAGANEIDAEMRRQAQVLTQDEITSAKGLITEDQLQHGASWEETKEFMQKHGYSQRDINDEYNNWKAYKGGGDAAYLAQAQYEKSLINRLNEEAATTHTGEYQQKVLSAAENAIGYEEGLNILNQYPDAFKDMAIAEQDALLERAVLRDAVNAGYDPQQLRDYAEALKATGDYEQYDMAQMENYALILMKQNDAIKTISNSYSDWMTILSTYEENSEEATNAINEMNSAFEKLLDLKPGKVSKALTEWGKQSGNLQRLAEGNKDAWAEAFAAQAKGVLESSKLTTDQIEAYEKRIEAVSKKAAKYEKGQNLDPQDLKEALELINEIDQANQEAGGKAMSDQDKLDMLGEMTNVDTSDLGFDENGNLVRHIKYEVEQPDASDFAALQSTLDSIPEGETIQVHINSPDGMTTVELPAHSQINAKGEITYTDPVAGSQTVDVSGGYSVDGTIPNPVVESKGTGGNAPPSGGGGGGKKTKDHKKPDTGTRYHTIKAKQANNSQNKQEVNRQKERAFGAEKIKQAQKEIDLQKESLELQRQYIDEITDYLAGDRKNMEDAFKGLGISLKIDENGVITNFREVEEELLRQENKLIDQYNDGPLDDEAYQEAQKKIDEAREYLKIYEETRDLYEEQMIAMIELLDGLQDQLLELTKTKIEIQIDISDEKLDWLEYMLEKIGDDAYQAAEAIAFLGDKTGETLNRIDIYQAGLEEILGRKGFSLDDLDSLTDLDLAQANFTQAEIDQIREWKSELMDANKELLKMREEVINKVIDGFDKLNEKVQNSYDNFNQYNDVLEKYKEITDLLGLRLNQQNKELLDSLGKATLANAQNQAASAKIIYETAKKAHDDAQKTYQEMVQRYGENSPEAQQWENLINTTQDALDEAQNNWLDAWNNALQIAQDIYINHIEQITKTFEEQVSGLFGSLDYLQSAFDRADQVGTEYLQDFEKLYELNKLNRDIQKEIDDSNNIRDKQALKKLQKEINDLQAQGVQLSQYDVDALRKKFELEQARQALEDARNDKSEVRLQRDANGNWGYVYTAAEDATKEAEQEYENKLYEYQKLNDDYIKELQSRVLETQAQYKEALAEIYSDTTLTDEQRQARIDELNAWKDAELAYFEDQLNNALQNQQDTLDLYYKIYGNSQAALADSWEETTLRMLTGADSVEEYINNIQQAMLDMLNNSANALSDYNNDVDDTNEAAGVNTEEYATHVIEAIDEIGEASEMTQEQIAALAETLMGEFTDALAEAVKWEDEYANKMKAAIEQNEKFIQSLNEMIARLAIIESNDPELKIARANYMLAEANHEKFVQNHGDVYDADWEKAKQSWQEFLDKYADAAQYDTGGYTGSWGSEGRMAILHEKENVFNAEDTSKLLDAAYVLRSIDLSAKTFATGLGQMLFPQLQGFTQQVLDQNVHIDATFPNVTDHNEIELAFDNLINKASQYANRKNMSSMTFQDMYTSKF